MIFEKKRFGEYFEAVDVKHTFYYDKQCECGVKFAPELFRNIGAKASDEENVLVNILKNLCGKSPLKFRCLVMENHIGNLYMKEIEKLKRYKFIFNRL